MPDIRAMLANLSTKGKLVGAGSVLGVVLVAYLLFSLAGQPSYQTILAGLNPSETGKITAALDQQGINYELQNNGTAVGVEAGETAKARVALAQAGLPGNQQPGFELFDKQGLGQSSFQQQVNYQRALEGEVAQTVEQVNGVSSAEVQLVLPQDQLFTQDQTPASAAVMLTADPTVLDASAVRGIARLVASSVKGLKPPNVTITDQTGTLLWPTSNGAGGTIGGVPAKQAAEARYDQQLEQRLNAMLVQALGPGKGEVQVNADLNVNRSTQSKLQYARKGIPLTSESDTETLKGSGAAPGGVSGTAGNIPSYVAGAGSGKSNYKHTTRKKTYGVDKTITHTQVAPGQIQQLSVALVLDKSVPKAEVAALRKAVAGAAGIQPKRGDVMSVSQVTFAKPPAVTPAAGPLGGGLLGYAKYAVLGLAVALFLFFMRRSLRRREGEELAGRPTWLSEIEAPRSLAELEEGGGAPTVRPLTPAQTPARLQVEDYAAREPERVAQQVRHWLKED